MDNKCMINGTSYELILSTAEQYPKLNDTDGYCDTDSKQIIVRQPKDLNIAECYKWWLSDRLNPIARREFIKASEYEQGKKLVSARQSGKKSGIPNIC